MSTIISDSCRVRHRRRARPLISSSKVTFLSIILVSSGVSHCCNAIEFISNDNIDRSNGIIDIADVSEYAENDELHRLRGSRKLESAYHVQQNNFATIAIVNDESNGINSARERRRKLPIRRGDPPPPPNDGAGTTENDNTNNDAANQNTQDDGNGAATGTTSGGGGYGDYGSYMNSSPKVSPNESPSPGVSPTTSTSAGGASNYGTSTTSNQASNTASYGSYGSNSYGGSTSGAATSSYGSGSSTSAAYGGSTSSYGSSTYGGSSTSTASTTTKDSYSSAWGPTGASGSSSSWGSSTGSSGSSWGSKASSSFSKLHGPSVQLSIIPVILLSVLITFIGMLITAHRMENDPEGNFANCCRVLLHTVNCIYKVIYNLYHCRLGDIPQVVFASELEEEEYTDEEIERMRLRPGIERALDVEHRKALRKVGIEMNKIKVTTIKR